MPTKRSTKSKAGTGDRPNPPHSIKQGRNPRRSRPRLAACLARAKREGWSRFIRTELDERACLEGYYFDFHRAEHPCQYARTFCRHTMGPKQEQPFELDDWQKENLIYPVFGWMHPSGVRRFRRASWWMPKKNGKTTLVGLLITYLLTSDGERRAQVYGAALDAKQAGRVWDEARSFVRSSPELAEAIQIVEHKGKLVYEETDSFYELLTKDVDAARQEGLNASAWVIDELHTQVTPALLDVLIYSGTSRAQPLGIDISTAGAAAIGVGYETCEKAKDILAGRGDNLRFHAFVAEAPKGADLADERAWAVANPGLGSTFTIESLRSDWEESKQNPRERRRFGRYRLNIWGQLDEPWLDPDAWAAGLPLDELAELPTRWFAGLDLSSVRDLSAFALVGWGADADGAQRLAIKTWIWTPAETALERGRRDRVDYLSWIEEGHVIGIDGPAIEYPPIRRHILETCAELPVQEIACDQWGCLQLVGELEAEGLTALILPQGYKHQTPGSKALERALTTGALAHEHNPAVAWQIGNAVADEWEGGVRPSKKKSRHRIDAVSAIVNAASRLAVEPPPQSSVYSRRGVIAC